MSLFLFPLVLIALNSADLERAIISHLNCYYPVGNAQYVCDISRLNLSDTPGFDSVAVDGYGKDNPRGQVVIRLSLFSQGQRVQRVVGSIKIGILRQVLIAAGPIRAGETFASGKISLETRDIAASDEAPLDPSSPLQGMIASRFVPAGRMLTVSSFQSPPLIKSGDHVMIEYSKGSLDLKADGIAKENGYEGKQIRVMNIDTKRIVNAVAIDSTTVAIGEKEGM